MKRSSGVSVFFSVFTEGMRAAMTDSMSLIISSFSWLAGDERIRWCTNAQRAPHHCRRHIVDDVGVGVVGVVGVVDSMVVILEISSWNIFSARRRRFGHLIETKNEIEKICGKCSDALSAAVVSHHLL